MEEGIFVAARLSQPFPLHALAARKSLQAFGPCSEWGLAHLVHLGALSVDFGVRQSASGPDEEGHEEEGY